MRIAKFITAAAVSASLVAAPAVAAPSGSAAKIDALARAGASVDAENELFRKRGKKRRGGTGVFAIIIIAIIISIGIYIIVDDDKNEAPASP